MPEAGISIAIYGKGADAYGVIDDRRWVDVTGETLVLEHVDPGAALASLVIEAPIHIGSCERDRIPRATTLAKAQKDARELRKLPPQQPATVDAFVPVVRCAVTGAPGRYLVRVLYVSPQLGYRGEHELAVTAPERATVTSRYAIETPAWSERADVTLYDGAPGGDHPPVEVAHGPVTLDGSTAVIAVPPREIAARVRRVVRAESPDAVVTATPVWVWLELPGLRLAPGAVVVHVGLPGEDAREVHVGATERQSTDDLVRIPLWNDDTLRATRQRANDYSERAEAADRISLSVANVGTVAREVWLEEKLRSARRRRIERASPNVTRDRDLVRARVTVQPGHTEHVAFTVAYDY